MKITFVTVDLQLSPRSRMLLRWVGLPLALLLGTAAIARAAHVFTTGEVLSADSLNALQTQIDAAAAKIPAVTAWTTVNGPIMRTATSTPGAAIAGQKTTEVYRRVGDSVEVQVRTAFTSAISGAGSFVWEFPPNIKVDTAKLPGDTTWASVGIAEEWDGSVVHLCSVNVGSGFIALDCDGVTSASAASSGMVISLRYTIPVMGWSITP